MHEPNHKEHRTNSEQAELEELWDINAEQKARISGKVKRYATPSKLLKHTRNDNECKRAEYTYLQSEINRHQEHGRDVLDVTNIGAVDIQVGYCSWDDIRAWVTQHTANTDR